MIVQKDFLNKLRDFGLNSYESKLWTALLSRGISTAGELSDIANVPRSRSYDVLESLEKKGFIIMKIGKPIKYIAVPPIEVIERVKKGLKEDAEKQITIIENIKETNVLEELNMLHNQGVELIEPNDISGSFRDRDNLYNHIESLIKNAKKSVTIITTTKGLIRKANALKRSLNKAKQNGVSIKIAAPITKETKDTIQELSKIAEVKHTDIKNRFIIIDGKSAVFMLMDDKKVHPSYDTGIWVNTSFFASAFENMFNDAWKSMKNAEDFLK
jgi:sugar-specific transcriptional regulator TrmB